MSDDQTEEWVDPSAVPLWSSLTELAPVKLFREKTPVVEARQHDGSWLSAETISTWIGPALETSILPPGTFNNDPDNAYIALQNRHGIRYVAASDWVVHDENHQFQIIRDRDFAKKYIAATEKERA
jgi:hypothetical protein